MRKLKPIPENTVVHTPTEAEAKELLEILKSNGYCWRIDEPRWYETQTQTCYVVEKKNIYRTNKEWCESQVHTILTLAEFKDKYCQEEKLKDIDHAIVCNGFNKDGIKDGDKVFVFRYDSENFLAVLNPITATTIPEKNLEPYTEPTEENSNPLNNNNMQKDVKFNANKELNLVELLKGHEGEYFYSPFYGEVKLEEIRTPTVESPKYYLLVRPKSYSIGREVILPNGINHEGGQVSLFPSRALYEQYPLDPYTAWNVWQQEQKSPFICIHYGEVDCNGDEDEDYTGNFYFRTPSDRDKAVEEIKSIIKKYNK